MTVTTIDRWFGGYAAVRETTEVSQKHTAVSRAQETVGPEIVIVLEPAAISFSAVPGLLRRYPTEMRRAERDIDDGDRRGVITFLERLPRREFADASTSHRSRPRL